MRSLSSGCPGRESRVPCENPFSAFQGCMRLLNLDNQTVDLIEVQQRLLGNYSHLLIDMCGITDRLVPRSRFFLSVCSVSFCFTASKIFHRRLERDATLHQQQVDEFACCAFGDSLIFMCRFLASADTRAGRHWYWNSAIRSNCR